MSRVEPLEVVIGVAGTTQFTARSTTTGQPVTGSETVKVTYVKQSTPPEYYNGSAWVAFTDGELPGAAELAMTEDTNVDGAYERARTYDEAGVDYIVRGWDDTGGNNVAEISQRVTGVQATEVDAVWRVQVTLKETDASGDAIPSATVSLRNADGDTLDLTTTDANGLADLGAPGAATYTVVIVLNGWNFDTETVVIAGSDASPKTAEFYGTEVATASPSDPGNCNVYGWVVDETGTAIADREIQVELQSRPQSASGSYYDIGDSEPVTDANGKFTLALARGVKVRVFSVNSSGAPDRAVDRDIKVPATATAQLDEIDEN